VQIGSVEITPVDVLRLTCTRAAQAVKNGRVALTPGGPIFSTNGYACRSTISLPL
jgi:hypothetical protein